MANASSMHADVYSETAFWAKVTSHAWAAGREVTEKAFWLYFAARNPNTPTWAKTAIFSALGYFIFPVDAVPDFLPAIGYSDDFAALVVAVSSVKRFLDEDVQAQTAEKMREWFKD